MTGSVILRSWGSKFVATLFVLAVLVATLTTIPTATLAKDRNQMVDPGQGSGRGYIDPRHGDDDQPTIVTPTSRRTTVQMTGPEGQGGGSNTVRYANLNPARRFFVRSRELLRRLFDFVP